MHERGPEFSSGEWDYAAGSVRGYRWWDLHCAVANDGSLWEGPSPVRPFLHEPYPRVTGMYGAVWHLDEPLQWAVAWCHRDRTPPCDNNDVHIMDSPCGCGFWAFWNSDERRYSKQIACAWGFGEGTDVYLRMMGAVEGAGRALIGTLGFRCAKMRVHAVLIPELYLAAAIARLKGHPKLEVIQDGLVKAIDDSLPGTAVYWRKKEFLANHPPTKDYA